MTIKPKYAPGPFLLRETETPYGRRLWIAAGNANLAEMTGDGPATKANGMLFAAAPELLEAGNDLHAALFFLRKAYSVVQEHYGYKPEQSPHIIAAEAALKKWVAAIAKTEGRNS